MDEKRKQYQKNYYQVNKEAANARQAARREEDRESYLEKRRQYYRDHKEELNAKSRAYTAAHKDHLDAVSLKFRQANLAGWRRLLLQQYGSFQCATCGTELTFHTAGEGKVRTAISWDHRTGKEPINVPPSTWLVTHEPTPENLALWNSCHFGMLCSVCNLQLGSPIGREQRVQSALAYAQKL